MDYKKSRIPWNKGLTKETDERVAKNAESNSISHQIAWQEGKYSNKRNLRVSLALKNQLKTPEHKLHISQARKGMKFSPKHILNMSRVRKGRLLNPAVLNKSEEWIKNLFKARWKSPNRAEQALISLFTEHNLPYKYVGNGEFVLGGKCPDFINVNGKKQVIELFGTYWHSVFDVAKRIEHFRQYGFSTLIIWEEELKNTNKVFNKVKSFAKAR